MVLSLSIGSNDRAVSSTFLIVFSNWLSRNYILFIVIKDISVFISCLFLLKCWESICFQGIPRNMKKSPNRTMRELTRRTVEDISKEDINLLNLHNHLSLFRHYSRWDYNLVQNRLGSSFLRFMHLIDNARHVFTNYSSKAPVLIYLCHIAYVQHLEHQNKYDGVQLHHLFG